MDKNDVTNDEFEQFVKATGYKTIAEIAPTQEQFPTAPPKNLVAGSTVFTPTTNAVPLNDYFQWWSYVHGANWRHPTGPDSDIKGKGNYPVVQVAYADAAAYAKWAGKRLPREEEWELASADAARESNMLEDGHLHPVPAQGDGLTIRHVAGLQPLMDLPDNDLLDLLLARREPDGELDTPEVNEVLALMRRPVAKVLQKGNSQ